MAATHPAHVAHSRHGSASSPVVPGAYDDHCGKAIVAPIMDGGRQTTSRRPRQAALDHQRQAAADSRQGHQQDWVAGVPESAIGAGFRVDGMLLIPSPVQCGRQVTSRVGMARTSRARRPKSAADLQSELSAEASRCRGPGRSTARRIGPVLSFGRARGGVLGVDQPLDHHPAHKRLVQRPHRLRASRAHPTGDQGALVSGVSGTAPRLA